MKEGESESYLTTILFIVILAGIIYGCAPKPQVFEVAEKTDFPVYENSEGRELIELTVLFQLDEDGLVRDLRLLQSSGDEEWDLAAMDSLRKWSFHVPPPSDGSDYLIKRRIAIEIRPMYKRVAPEPKVHIGLLTTITEEFADSLYNRLESGESFEDVIRYLHEQEQELASIEIRKHVRISELPDHVAMVIRNLKKGEHGHPIAVEDGYLIVKRY